MNGKLRNIMKKTKKKTVPALDEFHYHEALDRTSMVCDILDQQVSEHPVFEKHPDLKKEIDKAIDALYTVYSKIAKKMINEGIIK